MKQSQATNNIVFTVLSLQKFINDIMTAVPGESVDKLAGRGAYDV